MKLSEIKQGQFVVTENGGLLVGVEDNPLATTAWIPKTIPLGAYTENMRVLAVVVKEARVGSRVGPGCVYSMSHGDLVVEPVDISFETGHSP